MSFIINNCNNSYQNHKYYKNVLLEWGSFARIGHNNWKQLYSLAQKMFDLQADNYHWRS